MPFPSLSGARAQVLLHRLLTCFYVHLTSKYRQLEAIVRIAESQAKMSLSPFATETHIDEALRLFKVSTLDAALSGSLSGNICLSCRSNWLASKQHPLPPTGAEGFTSTADEEEVRKIERQLKSRFPIGSQVSEERIIQDFVKQNYSERAISTVLHIMLRRGELQHRLQRRVLYRVR